ncbi:MAG: hypothetical protein E7393_00825 [Ruminococcaceae bacterium]|nr:hypothetical protein [Oscillospiraceae bacterium]
MNTKQLAIILLIGVGLLLLPNVFQKYEKDITPSNEENLNYAAYEKELETRLANIVSTIRGVRDVSVMITLDDSGETYYARNEKTDKKQTTDGSLQEDNSQTEGNVALKNQSGGSQTPILLKRSMPKISGVLVTAKGVDNPTVQANVMNGIRAVLDVAAHRIQVLEKSS